MSFYLRDDDTLRGGRIVATLIGGVVLAVAVGLLVYALVFATAETRGRIALHNQQRSATALQDSYEYFHDTCRAVIAQSSQIETLQDQVDQAVKTRPASDPAGQFQSTLTQLQTQVSGVKNVRDSTAQAYNAKSHEFTRNFMRSSDLPVEIGPPDGVPYDALRCENQGG